MISYKQRLFLEKKAVKRKSKSRVRKKEENAESSITPNPNSDKIEYNKPYKKRTFVFPPKWGMGEGQYLTPSSGTFTEMMDMVVGYNRGEGKKVIIVYPGNFKPFNKRHAKIYNDIKSRNIQAEVFVATTDDKDFSYEDKQKTILASGVDPKMMVKTAKLFVVPELVNKYSRDHTILIFAVTKRMKDKKLKIGKYLKPFQSIDKCDPISKHAYIMTVPGVQPTSSKIKEAYKLADEEGKKKIIIDLYGSYKPELHKLFNQKFQ